MPSKNLPSKPPPVTVLIASSLPTRLTGATSSAVAARQVALGSQIFVHRPGDSDHGGGRAQAERSILTHDYGSHRAGTLGFALPANRKRGPVRLRFENGGHGFSRRGICLGLLDSQLE